MTPQTIICHLPAARAFTTALSQKTLELSCQVCHKDVQALAQFLCSAPSRVEVLVKTVADDWRRAVPFGHVAASAVLTGAIAAGPTLLGSVGLLSAIRELAAGLAVVQVALALVLLLQPLPASLARASAIATGWLLTLATARTALVDPLPGVILASGLFAACALAGPRVIVAAIAGVALGIVFCVAGWPEPPSRIPLGLAVDATYAGQLIAPAWFRLDRVLAIAALSIIVAGLAIAVASRPWRARVKRYLALGRIVRARDVLSPSQGALAVTALADPRWTIVGVGVIQWEALRIIAARAPSGNQRWRTLAPALRDATIPLSNEKNPLVRAARRAQATEIHSGGELVDGMWRSIPPAGETVARAHGRAIPFGNANTRGVLFALSESRADFDWLDDLAGALTVLGVGRAKAPAEMPVNADA